MIRWTLIQQTSLLFVIACGAPKDADDTAGGGATPLLPKALFIGIDGLRGDGIPDSETPHMDGLIEAGTWTLEASTQLQAQTVSGPGWTSMLTGVDADKHGITENGGWDLIDRSYPTLIGRAHTLGFSTATAVHWIPIQMMIIELGVTDESVLGTDEAVTDGMAHLLAAGDFDVHFAALDDVDHAGHSTGFSTDNPDYVAAVEMADSQVGQMLQAIADRPTRDQESWVVLITADHGGSGTSHGPQDADNQTIPLLIWGDPVPSAQLDPGVGSHLDIHPTLMAHMGHPAQASWDLDGEARGLE